MRTALQDHEALGAKAGLSAPLRYDERIYEASEDAAEMLEALPGLQPSDRLTLARVFDRQGANADAARHYRAWLALGDSSLASSSPAR